MPVAVDIDIFRVALYISFDARIRPAVLEDASCRHRRIVISDKVVATYWKDFDEVMMAEDFAVTEADGRRLFFVLRSLPYFGVDVYSAAPKE